MKVAESGTRSAEAARVLLGLPRFTDAGAVAYRPGLERIRALLEAMGQPHTRFPIVHIAGTNGKGSVASMVASIATAAGIRTGLHTSPHLIDVTERMRVDGIPAPEHWLTDNVLALRDRFGQIGPSFFEATVALSLKYFAEQDVELGIVEVGLGGRLDATNIVTPALSVITSVGLDHTDILGETVEEIAREKAGIIKAKVPVVSAVHEVADTEVRRIAQTLGAPYENVRAACGLVEPVIGLVRSRMTLRTPRDRYDELFVGLPMKHQLWNAALAVRAAESYGEVSGISITSKDVRRGLREVHSLSGVSGRFEVLAEKPLVVADVAHNHEGIAALLEHVREHGDVGRLIVCMAMMRDKKIDDVAAVLGAARAQVLTVDVASQRALPGLRLGRVLKQHGVRVDNLESVENAFGWFRRNAESNDALLFTGSHLVVAEALALLTDGPGN